MNTATKFLLTFLLIFHCLLFSNNTTANEIIFPGLERDLYAVKLLKHALTYSINKNYQVKFYGVDIPRGRDFDIMEKNEGISVVVGGATKVREQKYLPIRFPLLKGLNGWRIPLVKKENVDIFKNIDSLAAFKKLIPGQFHTWSDTKILAKNDITVVKGTNIEGLFHMLAKGRFDYFPRSIFEIKKDFNAHKDLRIIIEPHILIQYSTAYYFYVNKENHALATDIQTGLEAALQDGSMDKLFMQYHGKFVNEIKTSNRRIFKLHNPLLPNKTPLERTELWLH